MREITKQRIAAAGFSVLPMVIFVFVYFVLSFVMMAAAVDDDVLNLLLYAFSMAAASVFMCMLLKKRTGKRFTDTLSVKNFDIIILLLLLVFSWCAAEAADGVVAGVCSEFMVVRRNPDFKITPVQIMSSIIVAPIFEEIIFRYLGTQFAEDYYPLPFLCMANAVYFAVIHGYNVQGFANVLVYGVCAAYVFLKTKRLVYIIIVHMCHNALCMIDYGDKMFFGNTINKAKNGFVLMSPQCMLFDLLLAAICAFVYYNRYIKPEKLQTDTQVTTNV